MNDELEVKIERVDDIPLLLAHMQRMGVAELVDEQYPMHGNWRGLSMGQVVTVWLAHVLSEGDHRLNHVQEWVENRLETLRVCMGAEVEVLDFTDDRLAIVLDRLSLDECWRQLETGLNGRVLRVYDLRPERVRLDSTTASGYWQVTEAGLFQFGHSKDGRPEQPQVKVMLATLDPLGLPVVTQVVSGEKADDPLYVPAIRQVQAGLGVKGLLYVGDSKMGACETRAFVQTAGDYYLMPLSKTQLPDTELAVYLEAVRREPQRLEVIERGDEVGEVKAIAAGFEVAEPMRMAWEGGTINWWERRLIVRSYALAKSAEEALQARLTKAQAALAELTNYRKGKKRFGEEAPLRQKVEAFLQRFRVQGLLQVSYEVRQTEGFAKYRTPYEYRLHVERDEAAIQRAQASLGWRVYATNAPVQQLPLPRAILAYRQEYLVERSFGRLKGKSLSLSPMYLQIDHRATGLIRLLTIALRVLTLLEFVVRRGLAARKQTLAGLYAGNPKRSTARPTAEALLKAFKDVNLTIVRIGQHVHRHVTPLSDLQLGILALLDFPPGTYSKLTAVPANPP